MSSMLPVGTYKSHTGFHRNQKLSVCESSIFEYRTTKTEYSNDKVSDFQSLSWLGTQKVNSKSKQ